MNSFLTQLKWQMVLLQKNKIISISLVVTLMYALPLYFLRNIGSLDEVLVVLIMNDPSVIGYFFIGLAIYTEIKHQVLSAILVTPVSIHTLLISKVVALAAVGVVCSLGLALSMKGFELDLLSFCLGSLGICVLSALLGVIVLTFASEFLKFVLLSIPVFLAFVGIPLLQYFGLIHLGLLKYLCPVQGSLDLIDHSVSGTSIHHAWSYVSTLLFVGAFYLLAYRRFQLKLVL